MPAAGPAPQGSGASSSSPTPASRPTNTTQNSLLISEIRDGMVVMNDGSFRAVVACQSINFDLMSSREREGVEFSYQNFLNSLYFPIQIFVRSQRVDIGPYIDRLVSIRKAQDNMLLNVLMDDYINFIDVLSQEANIMDKSFFIVVPYFPVATLPILSKQAKASLEKFSLSLGRVLQKSTRLRTRNLKTKLKTALILLRADYSSLALKVFSSQLKNLASSTIMYTTPIQPYASHSVTLIM
ncbi:hypothetical protein D3C85_653710 [compost metagenome]